jgi:4-alpha-glucanotransferase
MNDEAVRARARAAGIAVDWIDASNRPQRVSIESLSRILDALQPGPPPEIPPLLTATVGAAIVVPGLHQDAAAELTLEGEPARPVTVSAAQGVPAIATPGYHTLRLGGHEITLAVAPQRCFTVGDIAPGERLWGLAAQIYSLARPGDMGIGDTTAVAMLARSAAARGADALALSPAHSLFPDDLSRFSPYAPSSRLRLNPLLIDPLAAPGPPPADAIDPASPLIDWPTASARKYAVLRRLYDEGGRPGAFDAFTQRLADTAFAAAQKAATDAGMRIGLITDLAIGLDRDGPEVGADPDAFLADLSIGAPPDAFNPNGQDWGLTTFSPHGLIARGFAPFVATLRASLRHAGGVRIDHAMGLMRLWLVPRGSVPAEGAYLAYPIDDLMRLLALESHRHRAVVIGEDLGTVPPAFRARCRAMGVAGMDVLWFQRHGARFLSPGEWRDDAVAMTTTHDLPTVAGWWRGADLELRRGLGTASVAEIAGRPAERAALWRVFTDAGAATGEAPDPTDSDPVVDAAIGFVARAPTPLVIVPLEDIVGTPEQPNLPGTTDQHPNWRRRFTLPADRILEQPAAARRLSQLNEQRPGRRS